MRSELTEDRGVKRKKEIQCKIQLIIFLELIREKEVRFQLSLGTYSPPSTNVWITKFVHTIG